MPAFEYLDWDRFEVFLYAGGLGDHPLKLYCRTRSEKLVILPPDTSEQAWTIREDDLDIILIGGNITAGGNDLTLLCLHRLARVQVTSIASPVTSGMRNMDYYIAGDLTAPVSEDQEQYREKLVNIEGPGFCFSYPVPGDEAEVTPVRSDLGGTGDSSLVFISWANYYKIIPEVREAWAEILRAVPESLLVLYPFNPNWRKSYKEDMFTEQMQAVFTAHGIETDRLVVLEQLPDPSDVREYLRLADVYLASFPFSGAAFLMDPLFTGLPAVVR